MLRIASLQVTENRLHQQAAASKLQEDLTCLSICLCLKVLVQLFVQACMVSDASDVIESSLANLLSAIMGDATSHMLQ